MVGRAIRDAHVSTPGPALAVLGELPAGWNATARILAARVGVGGIGGAGPTRPCAEVW